MITLRKKWKRRLEEDLCQESKNRKRNKTEKENFENKERLKHQDEIKTK
jgi:hypothetical protein